MKKLMIANTMGAALLLLGGMPVMGTSLTTVAAAAGSNTCGVSDPFTTSCGVSFAGASDTATSSGYANATWSPDGSGFLEATANDRGPSTRSTATVDWSAPFIVTGATGTGTLLITFNGFYMNVVNSVGGASVTQPLLNVGTYSTNLTGVPNGVPADFSVAVPVTFGAVANFELSFQATATGTIFMGGVYGFNGADEKIYFPSFSVRSATGAPIAGASVNFVPEPTTYALVALGLGAAVMRRVRRRQD